MLKTCSGSTIFLWSGSLLSYEETGHSWGEYVFYSVEILLLIVSFPLGLFVLWLCYLGGVFHRNLLALLVFNVVNMLPAHCSRLYFISNEIILGIHKGSCTLPIIIAIFVRQIYIAGIFHSPFFFCAERLLAVYFLQDYELKRRSYISAIFISLLYILSTGTAARVILDDDRHFLGAVIYIFVVACTTISIYIGLISWHRRESKHSKWSKFSSLSSRYQIAENLKVLELFRYIVISCVIMVALITAVVFAIFQLGLTSALVEVTEVLQTGAPIVVLLTAILTVERWRDKLLFWKSKTARKGTTAPVSIEQTATELYFQQLKASWG